MQAWRERPKGEARRDTPEGLAGAMSDVAGAVGHPNRAETSCSQPRVHCRNIAELQFASQRALPSSRPALTQAPPSELPYTAQPVRLFKVLLSICTACGFVSDGGARARNVQQTFSRHTLAHNAKIYCIKCNVNCTFLPALGMYQRSLRYPRVGRLDAFTKKSCTPSVVCRSSSAEAAGGDCGEAAQCCHVHEMA